MSNVDLKAVRAQVEILQYVKGQMAKLKELEKAARAAVEDAMGSHDVGMLDDEPVIHWSHFKERRFDQSAFGAEYPELLEQFRATHEKRRFEIL